MSIKRVQAIVVVITALTITAGLGTIGAGSALAQSNPPGFPFCDAGTCTEPAGLSCSTDADCVPPGTIFDVCLFDTCDLGTNTCTLSGFGPCFSDGDCPGDTCVPDSCVNGKCAGGGQSCIADADCEYCSLSLEQCAGLPGCAPTGSGICSVSRLACASDVDCKTNTAVFDGCMNDVYNFYNGSQSLECTANDIRISETSILTVIDACEFPGDFATVQLEADFELTAEQRHDVAVYLAVDGGDALYGTCLAEVIPEIDSSLFGPGTPADLDSFCKPNGFCENDGSVPCTNTNDNDFDACGFLDTCGDIDANSPFDGTILDVPLSPITLPCVDNNGDGQADLPSCLSWRQPGADENCTSPFGGYPGAPSKCRCEILDIPLSVPKSLEVVKVTVPSANNPTFDLIVDPPGDVFATGGDGTTTGRIDVSDGFCALDTDVACSQLSDCDGGSFTVEDGDFCDPSDRTVSELGNTANLDDYYSQIECVSRLGSCSGDPDFVCSLDPSVPDGCVNLGLGTCSGTPTPIGSCDGCTSLDLAINNEQTDILCTVTNTIVEVELTKECDPLSKVGDDVDYTITVDNLSGAGSPDLECTITDALLGIDETVTLAWDAAPYVINTSRTVLESDSDPLDNTASVDCTFVGGTDVVASDDDSCSTELFQPSISFDKTGDALSKVGDDIDYTITLDNTSSADTPDLTCTITDPTLNIDEQVVLAWDAADHVINATYTVQEGDPDPFVNTASVSCTVDGFSNVLDDSDDHSTELFQPSYTVDKTGDTLSKVGDDVDYTITVDNTSSADSPDLVCTITDAMLNIDEQVTLAWDAADHVINATYTVQEGDADPLVNTVDVTCSPDGFPNNIDHSDDHSVNLFQPSYTFDKTGDTLSKVGDDVDYTITLDNTSSDDSPDLVCTITDAQLGIDEQVTLAWNAADHVINATYTVLEGDADPLVNTANVTCSPDGFPNQLDDSDDHSVNLFQPSVTIDKTGDTLSKVGDDADYTITVNNTSSGDTPDLECTITDALLGIDKNVTLASGASDVTNATYTVQEGDADPFVNTANVSCSPTGFPNVLEESDDHSLNLFQPSITFDKTGDDLSKVGDDVDYILTLNNTSSGDTPDLQCTITDAMLGVDKNVTLASGASDVTNVAYTVPGGAADPLVNTASVTCSPTGFPNVLEESDDHSVDLFQASITFDKTGDTLSKVGDDVDYAITLENTSSGDTPDLECTITDALLGIDKSVTLASGASNITNATYTVPEGAPDPLTNTANVSCSPVGFSNVLTDADDHSVDLFQASITFDKTGDILSKVGDDVDYTLTLDNTSSGDTPDLECTITDTLLGINKNVTLASGATDVTNASYVIQPGDADPFINTAEVSCSPIGFPNLLTDSDDHSVNLFQASIAFDKTGDAAGKVGDDVNYVLTLDNTSSGDTPDLECSITDTMLGINKNVTLASGASDITNAAYVVQEGDSDPLVNSASVSCSPAGFPNILADSDDHSVQLFQASITFEKTGDALSKVGDDVNYTITLNNTSSGDTPSLECTITDAMLGINKNVTLASGASDVINTSYTVQEGDSDPLDNTASVTCSPVGYPNVIDDSDGHSVNLFQPSIDVTKTGDAYSKVGDDINYEVTIQNTSSADSPDLTLVSFSDSLVAGVTPPASCATLAAGESCIISYTYTVQAGDDGATLGNTATAHYSPVGYPNDITDSGSWNATLVHPDYTVVKSCANEPVPQDGPASYTVTFNNTGDVALDITADDGIGAFSLAAGASTQFTVDLPGPFAGQATVSNTVNASATIPLPGLGNVIARTSSDECQVASRVDLLKLTGGVVDPTAEWTFGIYDGPNADCGAGTGGDTCSDFLSSALATDTVLGDADGVLDFGGIDLDPDATYTICELGVPTAWITEWMVDTDNDGVADTSLIPYNPNASDNPPEDLGNRCADFGFDTLWPLLAGETLSFEVNNVPPPGGDARTPGYWKNWSTCSGGNQVQTADRNSEDTNGNGIIDPAERIAAGFALIDDVLPQQIGLLLVDTCEEAVAILDHREVGDDSRRRPRKRANDGAYKLARSLLAYEANIAAGAATCQAAIDAAAAGHALLTAIGFDGSGSYLRPGDAEYEQAVSLAGTLDAYNNNLLCGS